jgi:phospholipid/cholesterol/gamma-HCH transport system substrate-binding protein
MNKTAAAQGPAGEPFHRRHRNLFVGLFIAIPLIILPGFLLYTTIKTAKQWDYLYVRYPNANGLARNGAVTILGMKVGFIETVTLNEAGYIDVKAKIKHQYLPMVKKDSKASLQQKNVAFGDWEIALTEGTKTSPPIKNGDTLQSTVQTPIAKTLEQVNKTVETLQKILQQILEGKGTVGRLIKEDTVINLVQKAERNTNGLITRAYTTLARVDTILIKVAQIGDKGKVLADSVIGISGKVGKLITDVNLLVNSFQTAAKDVPGLMNRVQKDIADVELMLKALQNNVIIKSGISSQSDPMLDDNTSK